MNSEHCFTKVFLSKFPLIEKKTIKSLITNGYTNRELLLFIDLDIDLPQFSNISMAQKSLLRHILSEYKASQTDLRQSFGKKLTKELDAINDSSKPITIDLSSDDENEMFKFEEPFDEDKYIPLDLSLELNVHQNNEGSAESEEEEQSNKNREKRQKTSHKNDGNETTESTSDLDESVDETQNNSLENEEQSDETEEVMSSNVVPKKPTKPIKTVRHRKSKTKDSFRCLESGCNRRFTNYFNLREHSYSHTGEKPYVCEVCGKDFRYKSAIGRHKRIHEK